MKVYAVCERLSKQRGMTVRQVCLEAGVPYDTVHKWKDERRAVPHRENIAALADYFGVSPLELLMSDVDYSGPYYTRDGLVISKCKDKLEILVAISGMSIEQFAKYIHWDIRAVYRWLTGEANITLIGMAHISETFMVPLYVLFDDEQPLQVLEYETDEVNACSIENVRYNMRALLAISGASTSAFCKRCGLTRTTLEGILGSAVPKVETLRRSIVTLGLTPKQMFTDYTKSDQVHQAFCSMSTTQRMRFMMTLKGVTPKYVAETFGWGPRVFNKQPRGRRIELPWVMAKYFGCPSSWFTRQQIELGDQESLRTPWNQII